MKVQGLDLVCSLKKRNKKKLFDLRCKTMKVKVVSKDVGVGENDAKTLVVRKYSPACLKIKLQKRRL